MTRIVLVFVLTFTAKVLNAQYFERNLFVRHQWNELNKYGRLGADLPMTCAPNSTAKAIWYKAEQQLSKNHAKLLQQNRWDEEITFYKACIKADSSFCDAYFRLAQCLVELTDWVGVLKLLNLSQQKFPDNPLVYLGLGQAYLYLHFPELAAKHFEKVIALSPSNGEGYLGASMVFYETGQAQRALDYLRQGYGKVSGDILYLRVFEGILLYHSGQNQAAYQLLRDLQESRTSTQSLDTYNYVTMRKPGIVDPQLNALAEYYIGLCYAAQGENFYNTAIYHLKNARRSGIFIDSTLSRTFGFSIAVADTKEQLLSSYRLERVTDKSKAEDAADEAFENRKIDEAARMFSQQINHDSVNLYSYLRLAECYQLSHDPQKALTVYKIAAKRFPQDDQLSVRLVRQLVRVDSLSLALKLTLNAIDKYPKKQETYFQAALIFAMMKKESDGVKLVKKLELDYAGKEQNMPWKISFTLGELHYLSGNYAVAYSYLKHAIQHAPPRDPYLLYYYAKCLGSKGENAEAKKYFYDAMARGAILDVGTIKKFDLIVKESTLYGEN